MGLIQRHIHHGLQNLPQEPISKLAPFSALIISIVLVILFLTRFFLLEGYLIQRLYGKTYLDLSELNKRGFINHHIAGFTKIVILITAAYPFIAIIAGRGTYQTPYAHGSVVRLGDILIVAAQMLVAMYVFELIYRSKLSPIAVMHHIGTIIIGQTAIAINIGHGREPDANIEFILCCVWGAFDIVSEFLPHVAIILYRVFPSRHHFLSGVFLIACITTATGTTCETIVAMWLFGGLWNRWRLAFKIVTPILHVAFSATQIHGSIVFWKMYQRQRRLMLRKREEQMGL
ncbi:hypothetical protein ATEIFO6365_0006068300 [Aspergillus terreus]|uniref:Uncharacterized protein n=1 Tax=Aspergillus terreus TaxID=33178 RepID=A0A5M3Z1D6_ASPTE|nr:hypothetical protein ATETN484_0005068300 [Aspergillus terreus]GFF17335.1 hypothetical protein ATEIFO6365_0006068300 [Aspergillus terreus]